jgi:hypothetical protein
MTSLLGFPITRHCGNEGYAVDPRDEAHMAVGKCLICSFAARCSEAHPVMKGFSSRSNQQGKTKKHHQPDALEP